jgi:hypothetical protein
MTLFSFKQLDEQEQAEALWDKGVHWGERFDEEHTIALYQIDGFYVEVFYHPEYNIIKRLWSFRSTDQLRPYLEQIPIEMLLS